MELSTEVVRAAFRKVWLWDATTARPATVAEYLALFPGFEPLVAAEYERLAEQSPSRVGTSTAAERARVGPYRLDRMLGRGGQGVVYAATDTRDGRQVALKVLAADAGMSERRLVRLRREAEAVARVDHPGICRVHEAGLDGEVPYLALHLVQGRTLADAIARARRDRPSSAGGAEGAAALGLPEEDGGAGDPAKRVARFFEEAARAVHAAHEHGLIHRDLKPGNLMITPRGDPVVLDFGLVRDEEEGRTITLTGAFLGTPAYMAPEQIAPDGERLDRRADVYSLGVSLHEALTLRHPFDAPAREGYARAREFGARALADIDARFPAELSLIVETALRRDRRRRYGTALALAEDLRAFRLGLTIRARPPGAGERLADWARLHPALAAASAVAVVALAAALPLVVTTHDALGQAAAAKETARTARARVEKLIRSIIETKQELATTGRTDLVEAFAVEATALFESVSLDDCSDDELALFADACTMLAGAYETQGRMQETRVWRGKEFDIRLRLYERCPHDAARIRGYAGGFSAIARLDMAAARLTDALAKLHAADDLLSGIEPASADAEVRLDHCIALRLRGVLERRLGLPESRATLERAASLGAPLTADRPGDVVVQQETTLSSLEAARALDCLGDLTAANELTAGIERRAAEFLAAHPESLYARDTFAESCLRAADCAYDRGDYETSRTMLVRVQDVYGELMQSDGRNLRWRNHFASARMLLGRAEAACGRTAEAVRVARELRADVDDRIGKQEKWSPIGRLEIANSRRILGEALAGSGAAGDAIAQLTDSGTWIDGAVASAPDDVLVQLGVVMQRGALGAALADAAAARGTPAASPEARELLARSLAALGEAEGIARRLFEAHPDMAKAARQRAFALRDLARARRTAGDPSGAISALEEAVRVRDRLAMKDRAFVARLADLDALLAEACAQPK